MAPTAIVLAFRQNTQKRDRETRTALATLALVQDIVALADRAEGLGQIAIAQILLGAAACAADSADRR